MSKLISAAEVAERLAVSRAMVYRLVEKKRLPCVRVGAAVRIPEGAVAEFIARHTSEGTSEGSES